MLVTFISSLYCCWFRNLKVTLIFNRCIQDFTNYITAYFWPWETYIFVNCQSIHRTHFSACCLKMMNEYRYCEKCWNDWFFYLKKPTDHFVKITPKFYSKQCSIFCWTSFCLYFRHNSPCFASNVSTYYTTSLRGCKRYHKKLFSKPNNRY